MTTGDAKVLSEPAGTGRNSDAVLTNIFRLVLLACGKSTVTGDQERDQSTPHCFETGTWRYH